MLGMIGSWKDVDECIAGGFFNPGGCWLPSSQERL